MLPATCYRRHRAIEFRKFLDYIRKNVPEDLDVHVIVDNYATHSAPTVKRWLAKNPRFHLHFIPTHSSWLNEVEAWFSILTAKAIKRGSHTRVEQLEAAIREFLDVWNEDPKPFVWKKTADEILANVGRYCYRTLEGRENPNETSDDDSSSDPPVVVQQPIEPECVNRSAGQASGYPWCPTACLLPRGQSFWTEDV